jgi:hypothetical protein
VKQSVKEASLPASYGFSGTAKKNRPVSADIAREYQVSYRSNNQHLPQCICNDQDLTGLKLPFNDFCPECRSLVGIRCCPKIRQLDPDAVPYHLLSTTLVKEIAWHGQPRFLPKPFSGSRGPTINYVNLRFQDKAIPEDFAVTINLSGNNYILQHLG